jgi:RHS repeat-associated protein
VSGGSESETLYFGKLWTWKYDGLLSDRLGRNSKHIYLGDARVVTKVSRADGSFTDEEVAKQYYYHGDHLGSAQLVTNYRGEEYERVEYTPYGELWIEKASTASNLDIPYRFTGKERDEETGLYYYGARYLDAKAGRWLSADPALGEYIPEAPVNEEARKRNGSLPGMGGVYNTINAHLYHYAGNNPLKYTDPDGKSPWPFEFSFDPVADIINFFSQFDTSLKFGNLLNAASHGDQAAQTYVGYIIHEAGRDVLKQISSTSSTASLAFLAVGAPEAAGIASGVGMLADIGLSIDDALSGNYKDAAIGGFMIVAGIGISKAVSSGLDSLVEKGIKISVGENGQYYSVGRRGALNT